MPDYSKGKIYTIRCLNDPNIYVGSTIQSLAVRMGGHRSDYVKNKVLGRNKEIVKNISEWKIELHELFPCNKKEELVRREGEIIREIGTLNKNIAGRTVKEYYNDNIDKIKEYFIDNIDKIKQNQKQYYTDHKEEAKQYYTDHIEERKQYDKQYRTDHKEEINTKRKEYYTDHKEKEKQYYTDHKEEINTKQKEYRTDHKEEIKQYQKEYRLKNKLAKAQKEETI